MSTQTLYLVADGLDDLIYSGTDYATAVRFAQNVRGILAGVPVLADYRPDAPDPTPAVALATGHDGVPLRTSVEQTLTTMGMQRSQRGGWFVPSRHVG